MEIKIPKQELMDSMYKDNIQNQSIEHLKENLNLQITIQNNKNEDINSKKSLSPSSLKGEKKRRQGLWINNYFKEEEEKIEQTYTNPIKLISKVSTNKKEKKNIYQSICKIITKIKKYKKSKKGIIAMLITISVSLFFYDFTLIIFERKINKHFIYIHYLITFY